MRRVVTAARDDDGSSFVAFDGPPPTRLEFGPNSVLQLWAIDGELQSSTADPTVGLALSTDLAPGASRWILIEFGTGVSEDLHTTRTIDLGYVISGEITLTLDSGDVILRAGDVLVQQGTRHGWRNDGTQPCRLLLHVVGSRIDDTAAASPNHS